MGRQQFRFNMAEKHALDRSDSSYAEGGYENGSFKRQRVDSGAAEGYQQRSYQDSEGRGNPHYTEPSPVVHVRGIADEAREQDLLHALSTFGTIGYVKANRKYGYQYVFFFKVDSNDVHFMPFNKISKFHRQRAVGKSKYLYFNATGCMGN